MRIKQSGVQEDLQIRPHLLLPPALPIQLHNEVRPLFSSNQETTKDSGF